MNTPLVSVIVPIYNVKTYIYRGLENILHQSYKNIEILLIDDGSTDGSGSLCDSLSTIHENISVFHKQNEGAGSARNLGIQKAKGEYLYFFDIDDEIEPNLIEYCVTTAISKAVDMVIFGFDMTDVNGIQDKVTTKFEEKLITSNSELKGAYIKDILLIPGNNGYIWNKFYKKSFIKTNSIEYPDLRIQQDEVFNLKIYRKIEKIYFSSKVLYHYYVYNKGNTRSYFIPDIFDIYVSVRDAFEDLHRRWGINNNADVVDYLNNRFLSGVVASICTNLFHSDCPWTKKRKKQELKIVFRHKYTNLSLQATKRMDQILIISMAKLYNVSLLSYVYRSLMVIRNLKHKVHN